MILTFLKACESLTVVQFAAHRQHPFTTLLDLRHKIDEDVDFFQSSKDLAVSLLIKECSEKEVIPDYRSHVDEIALRIVGFCGIRFSLQAYFCTKTKSLARHQFFLIIWFAKDDNHFWLSVVDALTSFVHCNRFQHRFHASQNDSEAQPRDFCGFIRVVLVRCDAFPAPWIPVQLVIMDKSQKTDIDSWHSQVKKKTTCRFW